MAVHWTLNWLLLVPRNLIDCSTLLFAVQLVGLVEVLTGRLSEFAVVAEAHLFNFRNRFCLMYLLNNLKFFF